MVTADNQKAHIEQGTEIPYVTPGSANSPATVAFKKAVLRLEVTPQITPDNRIIMTVEVRKDNVGQFVDLGGGFRVPSIDTRNVLTQIHVNNGDTAVIGGIFEETITNDVTKVPVLGDIPVPRLPVQDDRPQQRKAGAPDLPHAARREGNAQHGEVSAASRRGARLARALRRDSAAWRILLGVGFVAGTEFPYNAAVQLQRGNLFLVGLPGAGKSTLGRMLARRLGLVFVDADAELEARLGVTIPTIFEIEGEAAFRDREEATLAELVAAHRHRSRNRRRRRDPRARTGTRLEGERNRPLPARRAVDAARAHAQEPASPAAQRRRSARASRRALRAARPALSRSRRTA